MARVAQYTTSSFSDIDTLDSSGAVAREGSGLSLLVRFELVRESGMWKVADTGDENAEGRVTEFDLDS